MKKSDIVVGRAYKIKTHSARGRAIVTGEAKKREPRWLSEKPLYKFPVEFPDSIKNGQAEVANIESRDFMCEWTDRDEEKFQSEMERADKIEKIEETLTNAGFEPDYVSSIQDDVWISFRGETANRVIEALQKVRS